MSPGMGRSWWGVEKGPASNGGETWKRMETCSAEVPRGAGVGPVGTGHVRDVMRAVFLDNEPGVDVPDGDTLNFSKFPKVFSLFWPISPFLVVRVPRCPVPAKRTPAVAPQLDRVTSSGKPLWVISSPPCPPPASCTLYTTLFLYPLLFRTLLGFLVWFPFQTGSLLEPRGPQHQSASSTGLPPARASPRALLRRASGAAHAP